MFIHAGESLQALLQGQSTKFVSIHVAKMQKDNKATQARNCHQFAFYCSELSTALHRTFVSPDHSPLSTKRKLVSSFYTAVELSSKHANRLHGE